MTEREHEPPPDYVDGKVYPGKNGSWWRCIKVGDVVDFVPADEGEDDDDACDCTDDDGSQR